MIVDHKRMERMGRKGKPPLLQRGPDRSLPYRRADPLLFMGGRKIKKRLPSHCR